MAFTYPSNPVSGNYYTINGKQFLYNGTGYVPAPTTDIAPIDQLTILDTDSIYGYRTGTGKTEWDWSVLKTDIINNIPSGGATTVFYVDTFTEFKTIVEDNAYINKDILIHISDMSVFIFTGTLNIKPNNIYVYSVSSTLYSSTNLTVIGSIGVDNTIYLDGIIRLSDDTNIITLTDSRLFIKYLDISGSQTVAFSLDGGGLYYNESIVTNLTNCNQRNIWFVPSTNTATVTTSTVTNLSTLSGATVTDVFNNAIASTDGGVLYSTDLIVGVREELVGGSMVPINKYWSGDLFTKPKLFAVFDKDSPLDTDDYNIFVPDTNITITKVYYITKATTVTFNINHSSNVDIWSSDKQATTVLQSSDVINNPNCLAGMPIKYQASAIGATPTNIHVTIYYTEG